MTDIASLRRATPASTLATGGVVIALGAEFNDLNLRVRPVTPTYDDILARAKSELVRQKRAEGTLKAREGYEQIPLSERQALGNRLALEHLFIGPVDATFGGQPLDAKTYREMAQTEEFADLMDAVWAAIEDATQQSRARAKAAGGNSSQRSDTTSTSPALPA
ncbi:hypothetical protein [Pseudoroseomonas ludipueritiae]|uniref:Uncharacterized protein n=1 Tax=Pseudoroseomonas ludipueritiae TaxID=198093 RepID=A0ABR7R9R7_9PROT|nr:hypothetical protein [Pseudoroseomonas ludipueritiae]MBC9178569.1 hypothetical protein [Pseudoroseomonas ludipueritiae]MCG7363193.1 hypothetical protein [Roseomonas sp. ACRSG]